MTGNQWYGRKPETREVSTLKKVPIPVGRETSPCVVVHQMSQADLAKGQTVTRRSKEERGDYAAITHPTGHVDSYSLLRQKVQLLKGKENAL